MEVMNGEWRASAAYLYVLTMDSISLAWEYLRRSPEYRLDWQGKRAIDVSAGERWGLKALEDPAIDAQTARPMWRRLPEGELRLVPLDDDHCSLHFSLWGIPCPKSLCHDGSHLLLALEIGTKRVHVTIDLALRSCARFGYAFSSGLPVLQQAARVELAMRLFHGEHVVEPTHAVTRNSMVHMLTLQVLDAMYGKASQRPAASAVFGPDRVTAEWGSDGELRARIRHYLHRGRALMRSGYLQLLYPSSKLRARQCSTASEVY